MGPRHELEPLVTKALDKYEIAFIELAKDNIPGFLKITRHHAFTLDVEVQNIGIYKFYIDEGTQMFSLSSPESGIYNYEYDKTNNFWKSLQQVHLLDELLARDFIYH